MAGTRPEAIKMVPVIQRLRREPERFQVTFCATAQHRQLLDQVLGLFGLTPDLDLDLMRADQTLNGLASRLFTEVDRVLTEQKPDWLLVQATRRPRSAAPWPPSTVRFPWRTWKPVFGPETSRHRFPRR